MTTHVITTPEVDTQVRTIDEWWRANRPAAPDLFTEELADCFALLEQLPNIGKRYSRYASAPDIRRVPLRASRYHVYYVVRGNTVAVIAVWHSQRGQLPAI